MESQISKNANKGQEIACIKNTFSLDTITNNLFNSECGKSLLLNDAPNLHEKSYETNTHMDNLKTKEEEKEYTVKLTCTGPNVEISSSVYHTQHSLLQQVLEAERAAHEAERVNENLRQELDRLHSELLCKNNNQWKAINRERHARELLRKYKENDDAARRRNAISSNSANLLDVSHLPLCLLNFPIDVRSGIATIDGVRLGFVSSTETMRYQELIYAVLFPYHKKTSLEYSNASGALITNEHNINNESCNYYDNNNDNNNSSNNNNKVGDVYAQFIEYWTRQRAEVPLLFSTKNGKVQVSEVNTACGLLVELLTQFAEHHSYTFRNVILHPNGSQATITLLKESEKTLTSVESPSTSTPATVNKVNTKATRTVNQRGVIGSVDFYISERFFAWRTFPSACEAIANCVNELCELLSSKLISVREEKLHEDEEKKEEVKCSTVITVSSIDHNNSNNNIKRNISQESSFSPNETSTTSETVKETLSTFPFNAPYRITKGAIDGTCVRHGSVNEMLWSLAMKKLLTNVQWCVAATALLEQHKL